MRRVTAAATATHVAHGGDVVHAQEARAAGHRERHRGGGAVGRARRRPAPPSSAPMKPLRDTPTRTG